MAQYNQPIGIEYENTLLLGRKIVVNRHMTNFNVEVLYITTTSHKYTSTYSATICAADHYFMLLSASLFLLTLCFLHSPYYNNINLLMTKCNLLYLNPQTVPHCTLSQLQKALNFVYGDNHCFF